MPRTGSARAGMGFPARFSIFAIGVCKKKHQPTGWCFFLEAPPGFEPGVKDLQSHALPLGYGAKKWSGQRDSNSLPPPWQGGAGGNNRARTCDPLLVRQVLSRLSYAPVSQLAHYTRRQKNCQGIFGNFFGKCTFSGRRCRPEHGQFIAASAFSASSSVCSSAGVKTYSASQNWQCTCVSLPSAIMSCSSCTPHWRSACSTRAREHAQR